MYAARRRTRPGVLRLLAESWEPASGVEFEWQVLSHSRPEGPSQPSSCLGGASETAAGRAAAESAASD